MIILNQKQTVADKKNLIAKIPETKYQIVYRKENGRLYTYKISGIIERNLHHLIGYSLNRHGIRQFNIDRIVNIKAI